MIVSLALLTLGIAGLLDAGYLTYLHLYHSGACGVGGCGEVLGSTYATFMGTPLSSFGLGFYGAAIILAWRSLEPSARTESIRWLSLLASVALLAGLYLIYVQAFMIGAWCPFCLLSVGLTLSLLLISLWDRRQTRTLAPFVGLLGSRHLLPPVLSLILFPVLTSGLSGQSHTPGKPESNEVIARIGNREITVAEIDHANRLKLYESRNGYRKEWLDRQLLETAAKTRGMDVRKFVQEEVYKKIEISQAEIDRRYEEIKNRIPANVTKQSVTRNIRNDIGNKKSKSALDRYVRKLAKEYGTVYTVPPSERFAFEPNPRGGPEKGTAAAPITIVEFSDLQCRYCSRAHTHLKTLESRFEGRIRVVFKHLPLDMHEHARYAAEVAACVNQQGLFWPVADSLFAHQNTMTRENILGHVEKSGADMAKLKACQDSGTGRRAVAADVAEADELGISSTPTFFINGHYVGTLPQDGLEPLINEELRSLGALSPPN
jgi:protein-disulfide isomerase/uncharacterized membrane protein